MTCHSAPEWAAARGVNANGPGQVVTTAQLQMRTLKSRPILPTPSCKAPLTALKQIQLNFISCLALSNADMSSVKHDPVLQSGPIFLEMGKQEEAKVIIENS